MAKKLVKRPSALSSDGAYLKKLHLKISNHIDSAKKAFQRSIDTEMVKAYWLIGRDIFKEEQRGKVRAEYGRYLIKELSKSLTRTHGKGFGLSTLKDMRLFYITYSQRRIGHALSGQSKEKLFSANLGWTHYRNLMRIDRPEARRFYEIEAEKNH